MITNVMGQMAMPQVAEVPFTNVAEYPFARGMATLGPT
jgi:hypothetical protein